MCSNLISHSNNKTPKVLEFSWGFFPIFIHAVNRYLSAFHLTWPEQICPQSSRFAGKVVDNIPSGPSGSGYSSLS